MLSLCTVQSDKFGCAATGTKPHGQATASSFVRQRNPCRPGTTAEARRVVVWCGGCETGWTLGPQSKGKGTGKGRRAEGQGQGQGRQVV